MSTTVGNINLFTRDIEQTRRFYVEVIGLVEIVERSVPPTFFLLNGGSCTVTLQDIHTPGADFVPGTSIELGFAVDDVAAVGQQLQAWGMAVGDLQQMGWGLALESYDPDGRRLIIFRMTEET